MDSLWSTDEWSHGDVPPASLLVEPARSSVERMVVEVVRSTKRRKSVSASIVDGKIVVRMPHWMTKAQEAEYVESLRAKLERQHNATTTDLTERAAALARRYRLPAPTSIRWVSNQRSRWGSC